MSRCVITVVTASHLPAAIVMAKSVREYDSSVALIIVVIDISQENLQKYVLPGADNLLFVGGDLLQDKLLENARAYYSAFELCCSAKPFALCYALSELGYEKAIYLDSDILCYDSLEYAWNSLNQNDFILTPHVMSPCTSHPTLPSEWELMNQGFMNAGFIGVRQGEAGSKILEWLKTKCIHFGFNCMPYMFVDQPWVSSTAWVFPFHVQSLLHAGMNVAYWNLHERQITMRQAQLYSNEDRLVFFHFSGFESKHPDQLTKYQIRSQSAAQLQLLLPLQRDYAARLEQARLAMPKLTPDFPCNTGSLYARMRAYRRVHAKPQHFAERAILSEISLKAAALWRKLRR